MNPIDTAARPATLAAWRRLAQVRPRLAALRPLGDCVRLPARTLLHAGPPLARPPCAPMLNSAVQAVLFEGWADTPEAAHALIADGSVRLAAAQDHDCVVPLASVLSPGQQVQVVQDASGMGRTAYAPLNGGSGPALRLGLPGPQVLAHLRWLNGPFAHAVRGVVPATRPLLSIADLALHQGDDCHGRTAAGSRALLEDWRAAGLAADGEAARFLADSPSFFLNLWMAAAKCMLSAAEGVAGSTLVTAMAGNGSQTGIQLAGLPGRWFTAAAAAPVGRIEPGRDVGDALPAIGDSALVETLGFGALAMQYAPAQREALGAYMPDTPERLCARLLLAPHPACTVSHVRVGLDAEAVLRHAQPPVVALGILDRKGMHGRIGGGIWQAPIAPFQAALAALAPQPAP
ncbi:DUF1116 domain-containing protein [Verticiella sediminum]|uniref:DUF1116 domain-containing protein n=1 Tax=Verticiella sediminum TaxID=1247510 RepID=A0A556AIL5_9BURK|nr:DUF1116 domain-containing protein [Verticiella sediminum]TSH92711.1 DUF1116 domain-containing protein [Verticiella sediminum]